MQFLINNNFHKFNNLLLAHEKNIINLIVYVISLVHNVNNFRNVKLNNLISQLKIAANKK